MSRLHKPRPGKLLSPYLLSMRPVCNKIRANCFRTIGNNLEVKLYVERPFYHRGGIGPPRRCLRRLQTTSRYWGRSRIRREQMSRTPLSRWSTRRLISAARLPPTQTAITSSRTCRLVFYNLSAAAPGFKKFVLTKVEVTVAQQATVNVTLQIGDVNESVTVQADAVRVESSTGEISNLITGTQASQIQTEWQELSAAATASAGRLDYVQQRLRAVWGLWGKQ